MHQLLLFLELLSKRLAWHLASALLVLDHRVSLRIPLLAKEGALECKGVHDVHLSKYDNSCSRLLTLLDCKPTVLELEEMVPLAAQKRDDSQLCVLDAALLLVVLV